MARQRFDTAPEFNVDQDSVVIRQAAGSATSILEVLDESATPVFTIHNSGEISMPSVLSVGGVSSSEMSHLSGVSSNIQTQLNTKAPSATPTFTGPVTLPSTTSIGPVSAIEIGYIDGVTSPIQTQLDSKLSTAVTSLSGTTNQITTSASTGSVNLSLPSTVTVSGKVSIGGAGYHTAMPSGSLELGNTATNYYYTSGWPGTMGAGILASCLDRFEWVIHDSATRLASPMYYEGESNNIYIGRDLGWGPTRVVTTGQPSFLAYRSANYSSGSGVLAYNSTTFNQGNHYNASTYTFTAPVSGVYLFCLNVNMYSANGFTVMATILKNGGSYINGERKVVNTTSDFNITATGLVYLNKDETAQPYLYASSTVTLSGGQVWNSFGGYLLG